MSCSTTSASVRDRSTWSFVAGPFEVQVTGTRFSLAWDSANEEIDLYVYEGAVEVRSPLGSGPLPVRAAQRYHAALPLRSMSLLDTGVRPLASSSANLASDDSPLGMQHADPGSPATSSTHPICSKARVRSTHTRLPWPVCSRSGCPRSSAGPGPRSRRLARTWSMRVHLLKPVVLNPPHWYYRCRHFFHFFGLLWGRNKYKLH